MPLLAFLDLLGAIGCDAKDIVAKCVQILFNVPQGAHFHVAIRAPASAKENEQGRFVSERAVYIEEGIGRGSEKDPRYFVANAKGFYLIRRLWNG